MTHTQRTETPWVLYQNESEFGRYELHANRTPSLFGVLIGCAEDGLTTEGEDKANAAFIVKACNCHDELLAFAEYYLDSESTTAECDRRAHALIKKVRG